MEGDHDGEIEGNLTIVVGHQPPGLAVHLARVELGHELDALFVEEAAQGGGRHRLGEGTVERGYVGELHAVTYVSLAEVPIGEEAELQRRDRALDGHVDDADHEATPVEAAPGRRAGRQPPRACRR